MKLIIGSRALSVFYSFLLKYKKAGNYTLLLPSNICHDVFFLINYLEISYIFIDINENDLCINKEIVIDIITRNRRSILVYNHTFGIPSVPYAFFREIKNISSEVVIIDDRCLCVPKFKTNSDDSCIDLILYSTGYAKQVDLSGWGFGFVNDLFYMHKYQITFEKHKYLELKNSFFGHSSNYLPDIENIFECIQVSNNIEPDVEPFYYEELIAEDIKKWLEHKHTITEIYKSSFPDEIQLPSEMNNWRFNIRVKNRDIILKELFWDNLFASAHFSSIGTMMNNHDCQKTDKLHKNIINLFIDKYYTQEKAEKTVEIIKKYLV